jgi:spermidine synthase
MLGSLLHAVWAGIPLGLCVLAFTPPGWVDWIGHGSRFIKGEAFESIGLDWGIREKRGDPATTTGSYAWVDESKYYYIKVENEAEQAGEMLKRTLVLDNLIHGYFILGHPELLDYDYEHIYGLVAYRAVKNSGKVTFKPTAASGKETRDAAARPVEPSDAGKAKAGATRPPAGLKSVAASIPDDQGPSDQDKKPSSPESGQESPGQDKTEELAKDGPGKILEELANLKKFTFEDDERPKPYLPPVESSSLKTLFLGGGAYCFQRHIQFAYPGSAVDVAEIDPAVTRANFMATGLPRDTKIQTYWGDARQFVELHQDTKQYDLIFGDAFNDFSVPWHLTTREFNEKIKKMMSPNGVYMINIIDAYKSDSQALSEAEDEIKRVDLRLMSWGDGSGVPTSGKNLVVVGTDNNGLLHIRIFDATGARTKDRDEKQLPAQAAAIATLKQQLPGLLPPYKMTDDEKAQVIAEATSIVGQTQVTEEAARERIRKEHLDEAHRYGGFVGAWTKTAKLTFDHVYIFGTAQPGKGLRETFVVVASKQKLDLEALGRRDDDPRFYTPGGVQTTPKPYRPEDEQVVVDQRSRNIILTDDYAPVDNLLAPVAETRGTED